MEPHILKRNLATTNPYLTVGFIVGSVCFTVLLCLLCFLRLRRSETNRKWIAGRSAASFPVRGITRPMPMAAETDPLSTRTQPLSSQHGLTASIVVPEKSITHKPLSCFLFGNAFTLPQFELLSVSSIRPAHRPVSNSSSSLPHACPKPIYNPAFSRHSRSSSGFVSYPPYSPPPGLNFRPSSPLSTSLPRVKPVHQLFEPALPDELALVRYGEYLTVLQAFDDGWCLIARDTSHSWRVSRPSVRMSTNGGNVDIGLVPAWVFIPPLKGIAVTRPFRIESIDALRHGQKSAYAKDTLSFGFDFT